jgi:hypothetical protein
MDETQTSEVNFLGMLSIGYALRANVRAINQLNMLRAASDNGTVDRAVYEKWEAKRPRILGALRDSYTSYRALPKTVQEDLAMALGLDTPRIKIKSEKSQ